MLAAVLVVSHTTFPSSSYEAWSGTSMATPHVSAVAALVRSCHPELDNVAIRAALTATARDLGDAGRDPAYGFGLVQARAALLSLGPLESSAGCTVR
jgi:serine protease